MVQNQKFTSQGPNNPAAVQPGAQYFAAATDIPPNSLAARFAGDADPLNFYAKNPVFNAPDKLPQRPDPLLAVLAGYDTTAQPTEAIANNLKNSGEATSIQNTNATPNGNGMGGAAGSEEDKKKKEERDAFLFQLATLQENLALQLREARRQINEVNEKIREAKEEIHKLTLQKIANTQIIKKADEHVTGKNLLAVGADGKLKDKQMELALQRYEARTGRTVNRYNVEQLNEAQRQIIIERNKHQAELKEHHEGLDQKIDQFELRKKKLEEYVTKVETVTNKLDQGRFDLELASNDPEKIQKANAKVEEARKLSAVILVGDLDDMSGQVTVSANKNLATQSKNTKITVDSAGESIVADSKRESAAVATQTSGAAKVDVLFALAAAGTSAAAKIDPQQESGLRTAFASAHGPIGPYKAPEVTASLTVHTNTLSSQFKG
jgi:hypothetical protein